MRARLSIVTVIVGAAALAVGITIAGADGTPLKPNFVSAVPHHFTVQNSQQHEFLRFSNGIANVGDGPFQIRPEVPSDGKTHGIQQLLDATGAVVHEEDVSEFVFHPAHNHWHIDAVALYEFRIANDDGIHGQWGAVFGDQSLKTTFCLIDWIKLEGTRRTPPARTRTASRTRHKACRLAGSTSTTTPSKARSSTSRARRRASTTSSRRRTPTRSS